LLDLVLIPRLGGPDQRLRRQHRRGRPGDAEQAGGSGDDADDQ